MPQRDGIGGTPRRLTGPALRETNVSSKASLDVVRELATLPPHEREKKLTQLGVSPRVKAEVEAMLRYSGKAADFLGSPPALVRELVDASPDAVPGCAAPDEAVGEAA